MKHSCILLSGHGYDLTSDREAMNYLIYIQKQLGALTLLSIVVAQDLQLDSKLMETT